MFSSEEKAAKNYLWGLAIILFIAFSGMIFLSWVVDPLGILRDTRGFPKLCSDGIKTTSDRSSIPLLSLKTNFSEAIIGTSRIKRGFRTETFEKSAIGKTANLGISSLTMEELYQLSEPLIQSDQINTLWIGLDFGMFGTPKPSNMRILKKKHSSYDQLLSYFLGTMSFDAWRETTFVLRHFNSCRVPIRDYQGFIIPGDYWNKRDNAWNQKTSSSDSVELTRRRLLKKFSKTDHEQPVRYQQHLALLKQLIENALDHSVQLNFFINPSPPHYFDILTEAGRSDDYRQWKHDIQTLVQNVHYSGVKPRFQDFSGLYAHKDLMPTECYDSFLPPCPFYDFTHYRPQVGIQILREFQEHDNY